MHWTCNWERQALTRPEHKIDTETGKIEKLYLLWIWFIVTLYRVCSYKNNNELFSDSQSSDEEGYNLTHTRTHSY